MNPKAWPYCMIATPVPTYLSECLMLDPQELRGRDPRMYEIFCAQLEGYPQDFYERRVHKKAKERVGKSARRK